MLKILVVDDEKSIVKGLVETLEQQEDLELQIFSAWTVSEGLRIAKEVKLDILCSDIHMPLMNGFEFASKVLEYWKDCKIVFLTGYDTFDYIYKSIHEYGGKYILKNEEDKFLEMIRRCIAEVETERQARLNEMQLILLTGEKRKNEKERILSDLIQSRSEDYSAERLIRLLEEENILPGQPISMVMGQFLKTDEPSNAKVQKLFRVFMQLCKEFQYFYAMDMIRLGTDRCLIFAQKKQSESPKLEELLAGIQSTLLKMEKIAISFLYTEEKLDFTEWKNQIKLCHTLLEVKMLKKSPVLINLDEMLTDNQENYECQEQYELQIDKMLMERQFMDLADIFLGLYLSVRNTYELSLVDTQMYYKCIGKVASYIEKNVSYHDLPKELQRSYYHLRYMSGIDEIHEFVTYFLKYMDQRQEDDLLIQKIETYIMNHITEDISLATIARKIYFNPSYLSRFYKAGTGRNLSQFIKEAKILKAKQLLEKSDKKIGDISKLLGFESVGYFTVFFKKQEGMTPTEYRNNQ